MTHSNQISFRKLRPEDESAFVKAYEEFKSTNNFVFVSCYKEGEAFQSLIKRLDEIERGVDLPAGHVSSTFLFGFHEGKLIGRVMIRHELNKFLREIGGHIGYGVVPSERRKGYASQLLLRSLSYARSMGLLKVLVTCDEDNIASRKVIERAGGVLERCVDQGEILPKKRLYWIETV